MEKLEMNVIHDTQNGKAESPGSVDQLRIYQFQSLHTTTPSSFMSLRTVIADQSKATAPFSTNTISSPANILVRPLFLKGASALDTS